MSARLLQVLPYEKLGLVESSLGEVDVHDVAAECAYIIDDTAYYDFAVPANATLVPGRYLVSPYQDPALVNASVGTDDRPISPATIAARDTGRLPVVAVLRGGDVVPTPSTPTPVPTTSKPRACRTVTTKYPDGKRITRVLCD